MIEMRNPQAVILREIADGFSQKSIALTYAFIIRQEHKTADWPRINNAIMDKWKSKTALKRIKEMAWKFADEGRNNA